MNVESQQTVVTIANATELASNIVHKLIGEEMSNNIGGSVVTLETLTKIIALRVHSNFAKFVKVGVN